MHRQHFADGKTVAFTFNSTKYIWYTNIMKYQVGGISVYDTPLLNPFQKSNTKHGKAFVQSVTAQLRALIRKSESNVIYLLGVRRDYRARAIHEPARWTT